MRTVALFRGLFLLNINYQHHTYYTVEALSPNGGFFNECPINVLTGEKQNDERQGYLVNLIIIAEREQTEVFWRG